MKVTEVEKELVDILKVVSSDPGFQKVEHQSEESEEKNWFDYQNSEPECAYQPR